jgi:phage portal protein BeeE
MDSITLVTTIRDAVGAGVMSPNEGRAKFDLKPVEGGKSPYLQQQNYSLEALAKRDAQDDPFKPASPPPQQPQQPAAEDNPPEPAPKPSEKKSVTPERVSLAFSRIAEAA